MNANPEHGSFSHLTLGKSFNLSESLFLTAERNGNIEQERLW